MPVGAPAQDAEVVAWLLMPALATGLAVAAVPILVSPLSGHLKLVPWVPTPSYATD